MKKISRETQQKKVWPLLLITFFSAAVLCFALYAAVGMWPFGTTSVITGDLNGQYINYFAQFRRALFSGESLSYSFTKSLGGSLLGLFAYYASSLFNVLYLIFPPIFYAQIAGIVLVLKIACAGTAFAFYAQKHWGLRSASVPAGLCYAFMSYNLAYAQNIMWHDVVILTPLVCWGIDRLIEEKRPLGYLGWLTLAIYSNFYIAYMLCIFSVLYFGIHMLMSEAPRKEEGGYKKFWAGRCLSFAASSLCAGLLCGIVLVPWMMNIKASKGIGERFAFTFESLFPLKEAAQQFWPGNFVWENVQDGLPLLYCGLTAVILALCFFVCRNVKWKEKLLWGGMLAVLMACFMTEGLNLIWHGFAKPVWFPYRNSFLFDFVVLTLACGTLAKARCSKRGVMLGLGLFAAFGLWSFLIRYESLSMTKLVLGGACAAAALTLWVLSRSEQVKKIRFRQTAGVCSALLVAAELAVNGFIVMDSFEKYTVSGYQQFYTDGTAAVQAVRAADDGEYRMEETYFRSWNDPMLLGFHGLRHFGSTMDDNSADFLVSMGLDDLQPFQTGTLPSAEALLGVKYLLTDDESVHPMHYVPTEIAAPYFVYRNPYALPMAFTAASQAADCVWDRETDSLFEIQNRVYSALLGKQTPLYAQAPLRIRDSQGKECTVPVKTDGMVEILFEAPAGGACYLHLHAPIPSGVHLTVNGTKLPDYDTALFNGAVYLGEFEKGESIVVQVRTQPGVISRAAAASLDQTLLEQSIRQLREGACEITLSDAQISVQAENKTQGLIYLAVPYDENWKLTVNGEETQIVPILNGMLMGIPVPQGKADAQLSYQVPHRLLGLFLSLLGIAGTAGMIAYYRKQNGKTA